MLYLKWLRVILHLCLLRHVGWRQLASRFRVVGLPEDHGHAGPQHPPAGGPEADGGERRGGRKIRSSSRLHPAPSHRTVGRLNMFIPSLWLCCYLFCIPHETINYKFIQYLKNKRKRPWAKPATLTCSLWLRLGCVNVTCRVSLRSF